MAEQLLSIGLMSGTSLDGVDAALVETDGAHNVCFKGSAYVPYSKALKERLSAVAQGDVPLNEVLRVEKELTLVHAQAVKELLEQEGLTAPAVRVIGFHGQTIRHLPDEGFTWQIGNAQLLAEETGIKVVSDFRRRDMAAGGQGAPLVPAFHEALFEGQEKPLAVLNIGGVANLTYIEEGKEPTAGDTGPGMGLVDAWIQAKTGQSYDEGGKLALSGTVDEAVVQKAVQLPFVQKSFPKSADRYDFEEVDVSHLNTEDGAATLCAVTAACVGGALEQLPSKPKNLWVTGGGAENEALLKALQVLVPNVRNVKEAGLRPDSMEAECFAWLAVRHMKGLPFTYPSTTGAKVRTVGGVCAA